jgi:hypothetical protein
VIRVHQTASTETAAVDPAAAIDARGVLDFLRQRGVEEPPAFGQVVERSL